jgi:hypothetical protein
MMNLDLDVWEARAALCDEATIPGELLQELVRLAKLGQGLEKPHRHRNLRLVK